MVMFLRKHPLTFLLPLLKSALIIAIPFLLMKYLLANKWLALVFVGLIVVGVVLLIYEWFTWYLDSYLITNKRIVRIHQKGLFSREVRETSYDKIIDITFKVEGMLATLFNFGHVNIFTTISKDPLILFSVSNPQEVKEKISEVCAKIQKASGEGLTAEDLVKFIEKIKVGRFTKKIRAVPEKKKVSHDFDILDDSVDEE